MKAFSFKVKGEKKHLNSSLHYIGLGMVYALGIFVIALQIRALFW